MPMVIELKDKKVETIFNEREISPISLNSTWAMKRLTTSASSWRTRRTHDMTNKKLGNDFESEFCEILFNEGFWVHNMAQNASGQPADVIAARNGKTYLIDCKVCSAKGFALSRMEENQDLSMELWKSCGNGEGWFALLTGGETITMIPHFTIKAMRNQQSYMSEVEIRECGVPLDKWLKKK